MKIALLASARSVHTRKIANSLADHHEVFVFSLADHRDEGNELDPRICVRYFRFRGKKSYLCNHWQLRRWIHELGIDVLNAHYASGYGMIAALARFHPYALSVWGSDIYSFPSSRLKRRLLEFNLKRADALFSTSHSMARATERFAHDREIIVTPFGVDIEMFSPVDPLPEETHPLRIGLVKTLARTYGISDLIRAFAIVRSENPAVPLELVLYGHGPLEEELRDLAARIEVQDHVSFLGRIPHSSVPGVLREIDIFCVPSLQESFGVAAVEAMACGIPCVTTDASGLAEVMRDGVTGFVVPRGDQRALAHAISSLVRDQKLRKRMGAAGRDHVLTNYSWADNLRVIEKALDSLAATQEWHRE